MDESEAQVGISSILRPPNNYRTDYERKAVDSESGFPLYLTSGGQLADEAGNPGYDQNLMRGLAVPMGSELILWIPNLVWTDGAGATFPYEYMLIWRLRNVFDHRQSRIPYHFRGSEGSPDTRPTAAPPERTLIPAAYDTIVYDQSAPLVTAQRAIQSARAQDVQFAATQLQGAALDFAGTEGAVQQGVYDPTAVASATRPSYMTYRVKALGDELLLGIKRPSGTPESGWAFGGVDLNLATFLGDSTSKNGVYVFASNM